MLNQRLQVLGHIGTIDEVKTVKVGSEDRKVMHFTVAVNIRRPGSDDKSDPMWVRVTAWNGLATAYAPHLVIGSRVLVEGPLSFDRATGGPAVYAATDKETGEIYGAAGFEMTANDITMLGDPRPKDEQPVEGKRLPVRSASKNGTNGAIVEAPNGEKIELSDGIPF